MYSLLEQVSSFNLSFWKKDSMSYKKCLLGIVMLLAVFHATAQNWELNTLKSINPQYPTSDFWKVTSTSAYYIGGMVPLAFLIEGFIKKDPVLKHKSYDIFGSIVINLIVTSALKASFDRNRPAQDHPIVIFPYKEVTGRSFPSGHTSLAFTTAASLSIQCKKWYVTLPAYAWAASVGYSRMYLGVHYPTDVIAGAAIGVGSAYLGHWLNKKIFPRNKKSTHKAGT